MTPNEKQQAAIQDLLFEYRIISKYDDGALLLQTEAGIERYFSGVIVRVL